MTILMEKVFYGPNVILKSRLSSLQDLIDFYPTEF